MEFSRWYRDDLIEPEVFCLSARAWVYKRLLFGKGSMANTDFSVEYSIPFRRLTDGGLFCLKPIFSNTFSVTPYVQEAIC